MHAAQRLHAIVGALAAILMVCAAASAQNLVVNPDFEVDANGDGVPDGWTFAWRTTHASRSCSEDPGHASARD